MDARQLREEPGDRLSTKGRCEFATWFFIDAMMKRYRQQSWSFLFRLPPRHVNNEGN